MKIEFGSLLENEYGQKGIVFLPTVVVMWGESEISVGLIWMVHTISVHFERRKK